MSDLDAAVRSHVGRMPEPIRGRLAVTIDPAAEDALQRDVLLAYLRMLVRIFDRDEPREEAERKLAAELNGITGCPATDDVDADITAAARGLSFLGGRTPPYLGPYIWARTESRRFEVELPRDPLQEVTVHVMHYFLIRGSLHWKTLGAQGAGGWYQQDNPPWPNGLYCVAERYPEPLETNRSFQVSLLGHDQPHPWAANRIVRNLEERLGLEASNPEALVALPYEEIRRGAIALLDEDTARQTARA